MAENMNREQLKELAQQKNMELSDAQLDSIAGGNGNDNLQALVDFFGGAVEFLTIMGEMMQFKRKGKSLAEYVEFVKTAHNQVLDPANPDLVKAWNATPSA